MERSNNFFFIYAMKIFNFLFYSFLSSAKDCGRMLIDEPKESKNINRLVDNEQICYIINLLFIYPLDLLRN